MKTVIIIQDGDQKSIRVFRNVAGAYAYLKRYCRYSNSLRQLQRNIRADAIFYHYTVDGSEYRTVGGVQMLNEIPVWVSKFRVE